LPVCQVSRIVIRIVSRIGHANHAWNAYVWNVCKNIAQKYIDWSRWSVVQVDCKIAKTGGWHEAVRPLSRSFRADPLHRLSRLRQHYSVLRKEMRTRLLRRAQKGSTIVAYPNRHKERGQPCEFRLAASPFICPAFAARALRPSVRGHHLHRTRHFFVGSIAGAAGRRML